MTAPCPICGQPATPEFRPFCSSRCKHVDLNRWLSEVYRVPAEPAEADGDDASTDAIADLAPTEAGSGSGSGA